MRKGCMLRSVVLLALCAAAVAVVPMPKPKPVPEPEPEPEPKPNPVPVPVPVPKPARKVECRLPQYKSCYRLKMSCPPSCNETCFLDCTLCTPVCACTRPGAVCQDPRFVGGDGISFYFHGRKDGHFCLVTDNNLHINAHFIGKRKPGMTRDFTWVQSLSILFGAHKLYVGAMRTAVWDDASDRLEFAFDGHPVSVPANVGATWTTPAAPGVSITRTRATNAVTVESKGSFAITAAVVPITAEDSRVHKYEIAEDDCFAHLDLGFKFYDLSDGVDGVLGQTYRANYTSKVNVGAAMPVVGGEREFTSTGLFAADCASTRFTGAAAVPAVSDASNYGPAKEHGSLNCVGGAAAGVGVFCKK